MKSVTQRDLARLRTRCQAFRDNRCLLRRAPPPPSRTAGQNLHATETVPINWQITWHTNPHIIAERWMPLVIHELLAGSTRFNDIRRGVPLMSQTLLSTRLKELERVGIVERRDNGGRAREWHLTDAGKALGPLIHQFGEWGLQYAQDPLEEDDLDVTVLVWNIKRRVDPGVFPGRRTTVHFDFIDAPEGKRLWWLVNERGVVDLCPFDPGFPVDLYVTTDLRTMIAVWFGKLTWDAGVRSEKIEVIGPRQLRERLRTWFLLSPIAMKSHTELDPPCCTDQLG